MHSPSYLLYLAAQYLHARPKADKSSAFRITPAIEILRRHTRLNGHVRVLDLGPRNVEEVRLLEAANFGTVDAVDLFPTSPRIRRGDMHALPFDDNGHDLVVASHVFEHALDGHQAAREIARVLRPGGYLWIAVPRGVPPNRHDRLRFDTRADVLTYFAGATPEVVWDGTREPEIRLLLRLWKEPPAEGSRHVLLMLSHSMHCRNWVASGQVRALVDAGHRVTLLAPTPLRTAVLEALGSAAAHVTVRPVEPYLGGRFRLWLRGGPLRTASYVHRAATSTTYRHKLALRRGGRDRVEQTILRALARAVDLETMATVVSRMLPLSRAARRLLRETRPDVVVVPSFLHVGDEVEILRSAKRVRIPTVLAAATWDTLVTKGPALEHPDHLLVWGDQSRAHAVTYHGMPWSQVTVTGPPHFDVYRAEGPEHEGPVREFGAGTPVVLVAGTTLTYWRDEVRMVRQLRDHLQGRAWVWYRPHPRRPLDQVRRAMEEPGIVVDPLWQTQAERGGGYPITAEALAHIRWLLERSVCVVTAFSTLIVEAALLGKPSLVVGFGGSAADPTGMLQHARYEHMREVVTWSGVRLCASFRELTDTLDEWLHWPTPARYELQLRATTVARCRDGQARQRIVEALERICAQRPR